MRHHEKTRHYLTPLLVSGDLGVGDESSKARTEASIEEEKLFFFRYHMTCLGERILPLRGGETKDRDIIQQGSLADTATSDDLRRIYAPRTRGDGHAIREDLPSHAGEAIQGPGPIAGRW